MDSGWSKLKMGAGFAVALSLAACGDKPQPLPQVAPERPMQQQRETLDQAKGVGQAEAQRAAELQQEAEKQAQ